MPAVKTRVGTSQEWVSATGSGVAALGGRQGNIPVDTTPTVDSVNPVQSGGVKSLCNNLQSQIDAITSKSDVVDVVGTYAELQVYDTSKLHNNDIVKVLVDETRSNAITYYRWSSQTTTWTYVGSQGPFYTKSEANSTFQSLITSTTDITAQTINAGITYVTTAPTADNTYGLRIAVLSSEPETKYNGWLYFITES